MLNRPSTKGACSVRRGLLWLWFVSVGFFVANLIVSLRREEYFSSQLLFISRSTSGVNEANKLLLSLPDVVTSFEAGKDVSASTYYNDDDTITVSGTVTGKVESIIQDSSTATVMGMAKGYGPSVLRPFVGSLRKAGFQGNIILAVEPIEEMHPDSYQYLKSMNITFHTLQYTNCTNQINLKNDHNPHKEERKTCLHPYPHIKMRWGRFPVLRDALEACTTCTGPVLITDTRDTFFQRDPFVGVPAITGLQVFQEHRSMTTRHWLYDDPMKKCRPSFRNPNATMLCSGTTIGSREAMLQYLTTMYEEMVEWSKDPVCCCNPMNGDDQTMHNYLYYSGKLERRLAPLPVMSVVPRMPGSIVNTVGAVGSAVREAHIENRGICRGKELKTKADRSSDPYDGAIDEKGQWLGLHMDLTDAEGYFIDYDGSRSRVVHQYDRFGQPILRWVNSKMKGKLYY